MLDSEFLPPIKPNQNSPAIKSDRSRDLLRFVISSDGTPVQSHLRPGLIDFLQYLSANHEPILFTAGMEEYASPLIDELEREYFNGEKIFRHRLYRQSTVSYDWRQHTKDVGRLGRDLKRIILVENSWPACLHQPDNCLIVRTWTSPFSRDFDFFMGEKKGAPLSPSDKMAKAMADRDLNHVKEWLEYLRHVEDVREVTSQHLPFEWQRTVSYRNKVSMKPPSDCGLERVKEK